MAQTNDIKSQDRKAFSLEVTSGFNYFFSKGYIIYEWAFSDNPVAISPYNCFIAGVMLSPQLQTSKKNNYDIAFGISYGSINYKQIRQTTDKNINVELTSKYSFLRPEVLGRFFLRKNKPVLPYVSAGFGFNFTVSDKPIIKAMYDFNGAPEYIRNQTFKIRTVSLNPRLATGVTYKRNRLELAYALPTDISDNAMFKLKTGFVGVNYYFELTKP